MIMRSVRKVLLKRRCDEVYLDDIFNFYFGEQSAMVQVILENTDLTYEMFLKFLSTTMILQGLRLSISMLHDVKYILIMKQSRYEFFA